MHVYRNAEYAQNIQTHKSHKTYEMKRPKIQFQIQFEIQFKNTVCVLSCVCVCVVRQSLAVVCESIHELTFYDWKMVVKRLHVHSADKDKKHVRGFALARSSEPTASRSSLATPVTLKTEVDSESSRRCTHQFCRHCTSCGRS